MDLSELPAELLDMIIECIDKKSRRKARLACKAWFKIFSAGKFEFYYTSKKDWKQITKTLSRYSTPISVSLKKNILQSWKDVLKSITKITNLASFSMEIVQQDDLPSTKELLTLSVLSNLTELNINTSIPEKLKKFMPQLQMHICASEITDELVNNRHVTLAGDTIMSITKLTALQHLSTERAFSGLASLDLTKLACRLENTTVIDDIFNDQSNHLLANLKSLELHVPDRITSLQSILKLTNLESLLIHTRNVSDLNLCKVFTKLKSFTLTGPSKLENLNPEITSFKSFAREFDEDLSFLSDLPNLENLNVRINDSFRQLEPMTNLTQLTIQNVFKQHGGVTVYRYPKLSTLFPNLESLFPGSASGSDMHGIIGLSRLTRLLLYQTILPNDVRKLTQLREFTICLSTQIDLLQYCTNMECLTIGNVFHPEDWERQIAQMKNLTQLKFAGYCITKINAAFLSTKLQKLSGTVKPWKEKQAKELLKALPNLYFVDIHPYPYDHPPDYYE